jgi:hypothetical protein
VPCAGEWLITSATSVEWLMREYVVDVSSANNWEEVIASFNRGIFHSLDAVWNGHLDAFNDYLYWPDEKPYRLIVRGWDECRTRLKSVLHWGKQPKLDVIAEILNESEDCQVTFC